MYTSSEREIILIFDAESRDGTQTLAYAKSHGLPVHEIDLRQEHVTGTQLIDIARKLKANLKDLINTEHPDYKEHYGALPEDEEDLVKMIQHHPEILQTPVAVKGDKVMLIRTPTDIAHI